MTRLSRRLNKEGVEGQSDRRDLISLVQASVAATVYSADIPPRRSHFLPSRSLLGGGRTGPVRVDGENDEGDDDDDDGDDDGHRLIHGNLGSREAHQALEL